MKATIAQAREMAAQLLQMEGLSPDRAHTTAHAIIMAEAWGLASHGLLRLPGYVERTRAGGYPCDAEMTVVTDTGPLLSLDGGGGLGHWQLAYAAEESVKRAAEFGISAVGVGNSGHCGALGVYALDIAERGMLGLVFSCGPAVLPPWGGDRRVLSTSPLAAGIPLPGQPAVVDLALSTVARGKIAAYAKSGQPLPDGWALDADGQPTNDANVALTGLLAPLGGAKGFALAFMVEALTAGLFGSLVSAEVPDFFDGSQQDQPQRIGHLVVTLDPEKTDAGGDPRGPERRLTDLADRVVAAGGRVPGSRRSALKTFSEDDELEVDTALWAELSSMRNGAPRT